jgi:hypothetical protein
MTLRDIKSLTASDFLVQGDSPDPAHKEAYAALVERFNELDPGFSTFLEHVRPDLMSQHGSPGSVANRVQVMSPFELVYMWSKLNSKTLDEMDEEDLVFGRRVHQVMWRRVLDVLQEVVPPVQDSPQ